MSKKLLTFFVFVLILSQPRTTFAYLDPGTGSFMIQMLIAAMVGASFTLKLYWKKAAGWVSNIFKKKDKKEEDEENEY